jgi:hypothetical protein
MMGTITKSGDRVKVTLYEAGVTVTLEEGNKIQIKVNTRSFFVITCLTPGTASARNFERDAAAGVFLDFSQLVAAI